jgi:hypothetical protein
MLRLLTITVGLLALVTTASAHGPSEVSLSYDAAIRMLTVRITHNSSSPASHYISKVEIRRDGAMLLTTDYQSQPAAATFSYTYPVEAGGGTVEVKASCSVFGSRTQKLDLPR